MALYLHYDWIRATEHAPRNPLRLLKRRHGLTKLIERGAVDLAERRRVIRPHSERESMIISENSSRHRYCSAEQCLGFFEVIQMF